MTGSDDVGQEAGRGRPTLADLRQRRERMESRDMETRMALRWAKDWLLSRAAGDLLERDAKLPEDADEYARAWMVLLKVALRELWDTYDFPPDLSYPRPFSDYEPPEDFDFGAVMERMHKRWDRKWREEYGGADPPYGPPDDATDHRP